MATKTKRISLLVKLLAIFSIVYLHLNCTSNNYFHVNTGFRFVDSFSLENKKNLYIYNLTTTFHEGSESFFAIGRNYCEIYNDSNTTFAKTPSYVHIDTVIGNTVYVSSSGEIELIDSSFKLKFISKQISPMDSIKLRLDTVIIGCRSLSN